MVVGVANYDAPITVDGNPAKRDLKLSVAAAFAADGADVRTVGVIQHLHAMIRALNHNQMTGAIQGNTVRFLELAIFCVLMTDGPQVPPIAVPKNLDAIVAVITHDQIALMVKGNTTWMLKLSFARTTLSKRSQEASPDHSNITNMTC